MRVEVRQWSDHVFSVYVFDGDRFGTFVDTAPTRRMAESIGADWLNKRPENRCGTMDCLGVCGGYGTMLVGELGCAPSGSATTLKTAGRLAPLTHQEPGLIIAAPTDISQHGTPIAGA